MKKLIDSKKRMLRGIGFLLAILIIQIGCSKSSSDYGTTPPPTGNKGGPGTNEVWIQGMAFTPSSITVNAGTTITWTNKDAVTHTVTSDTGLFNSGNIANGGTYSYMFPVAGTFSYHCSIHPYMIASVIVKAVAPAPGY